MLVYRDALDRASSTTDQRTLSDMLSRAEITGDIPLAKAVLWRGYELQNQSLVHGYFKTYLDDLPAWEEFTEAATEFNTLEALGVSGAAGIPEPDRPRELSYTAAATSGVGGEGRE